MDMMTLRSDKWLNDKVINALLDLLSEEECTMYNYSSFFMSALMSGDQRRIDRLPRITSRLCDEANRILIFPLNIGGCHWTLIHVDFWTQTIVFHDSLYSDDAASSSYLEYTNLVLSWVKAEHQRKALPKKKETTEGEEADDGPVDDVNKWVMERNVWMPQQTDSCSCGVFILMAARCILRQIPLPRWSEFFGQTTANYYRHVIFSEVYNGRLLM
jgi:Ulp1 family protease